MSDGALSQDEIDALLLGDSGGFDAGGSMASGGGHLSDSEKSTVLDLLNQALPSQAVALGGLIQKEVALNSIELNETTKDEFLGQQPEEIVEIKVDFSEGLSGEHYYIIDSQAAIQLAGPMIGQAEVELNDTSISAVSEAMSQMMGSVVTKLGDKIGRTIMPSAADGQNTFKAMARIPQGSLVQLSYTMVLDGSPIQINEIFEADTLKTLASLTGEDSSAAPAALDPLAGMGQPAPSSPSPQPGMQQAMGGMGQMNGGMNGGMNPQMGQMGQMNGGMNPQMGQMGMSGQGMMGQMGQGMMGQMNPQMGQMGQMGQGMMGQMGAPNVQGIQLPDFASGGAVSENRNIGLLMDVSMELTVELGRTRWQIKDILGMGEGTIVELDKLAGEPVDVLVNHNLIAKGEVVVIDENFGVRITEIVSTPGKGDNG